MGKNLYHTLVTWKALLQKDLSQALLHAELGAGGSLEVGMPQSGAVAHLGVALVMLVQRAFSSGGYKLLMDIGSPRELAEQIPSHYYNDWLLP